MVMLRNERSIDFSFIPSLECNIQCPFCMYSAGPDRKEVLDIEKTKAFIETFDWDLINSIGFYGGEPSINTDLYDRFAQLIPSNTLRFCISNGSWSNDVGKTIDFIAFLTRNKMHLVVSGTPYHKKFQNQDILLMLKEQHPESMTLKSDDEIHPMGRAAKEHWTCSNKCQSLDKPMRLGLFPNGDVLFQNCDGVYPVVQTYNEPLKTIDQLKTSIKLCTGSSVVER